MYPRFLIDLQLSETAKLVYILLLDRARLSGSNRGWEDEEGRVYISYRHSELAERIGKGKTAVKEALASLEKADLIQRCQDKVGRPGRIYVKLPPTSWPENRPPEGRKSVPAAVGNPAPPPYKSKNYRIQNNTDRYAYQGDDSL